MTTELPPRTHNEPPDLPTLSSEETTYVEAAREALVTIRRTFEFWIVIARGLKTLKDKAERLGGRFTFDRLREREGLGGRNKQGKEILNKTRVSRLLKILERLPEVETWRATLSETERFNWASPEAVVAHCPIFTNDDSDNEPATPAAKTAAPKKTRQDLERELAAASEKLKRSDGSLFDLQQTPAKQIADVMLANATSYKCEEIAKALLAGVKRKRQKPAG